MKLQYILWPGLLLACSFPVLPAPRAPIDPRLQRAYGHFVGTWSGTDQYQSDHGVITVPVTMVVTETEDELSLRFDGTFGRKGDKDYNQTTKFVTIDTNTNTVRIKVLHQSNDKFKASGLDDFLATGYGTFDVMRSEWGQKEKLNEKCVFRLTSDELHYSWQISSKDGPFRIGSIFDLKRVAGASSNPNPPK